MSNELDLPQDRMTFVKAPTNEPINLDMSAFDKPIEHSNLIDDGKKDIVIMNECMERHQMFSMVMQKKSANIKVVMNYMVAQNNLTTALNALAMIKDPTVTMDILNSTFAKNKRMDMLNFERVVLLMPHVQEMIDSKYETHIKAGLSSAINVLNAFSPSIIQIKQQPVHAGVDLAREDRLSKCDAVIESFFQLSKSKSFLKST